MVVTGALTVAVWPRADGPAGPALNGPAAVRPPAGAASLLPPGGPSPGADPARHRLFVQGSLAGTEPAGGWCAGAGRLQPCAALRERFDYYLLGLGEVDGAALRAMVEHDAREALGTVLAAQILALWDRYWTLRQQLPTVPFAAGDRSTWPALLAEQRGVRRRLLGDAWAHAFYADEERDFEALQARLDAGRPAPADVGAPVSQAASGATPAALRDARVAQYGAAAAVRLEALDAAWADWEGRLARARAEWTQLQQAAELSDAARREQIGRYVREHFGDDEQRRVRALLRL